MVRGLHYRRPTMMLLGNQFGNIILELVRLLFDYMLETDPRDMTCHSVFAPSAPSPLTMKRLPVLPADMVRS
jgi:hypothetical protein